MLPELIYAAFLIVFGVLIFIYDEAYGRLWRRTSIVRFPEKSYPLMARCYGAVLIAGGIAILGHTFWIWLRALIYR
jgi:hypothetical protein